MKTILSILSLICLSPVTVAQDDAVSTALERAKALFDSDSTNFENDVLKWFKKVEDDARAKGDRESLTSRQSLRAEFSKSGKMPDIAPISLRRKQERINSSMESAYKKAIEEFTRMDNDRLATQTEKQLEGFRNSLLNKPDRQIWRHSGGSFAVVDKNVWEEKISDGRSFRYQEIDRNKGYVELDALTGDTRIRVRLYDDRAEYGHKPSLAFKKHLVGKWAEK